MRDITVRARREPNKKMRVLAINQAKGTIKIFIGLAEAADYFKVSVWKIGSAIRNNTTLDYNGSTYRFEKDKS